VADFAEVQNSGSIATIQRKTTPAAEVILLQRSNRGRRKSHKQELRNLYLSLYIIQVIMSREVKSAGHVAQMGERRNAL
jgi:uncharacterized protein Veg